MRGIASKALELMDQVGLVVVAAARRHGGPVDSPPDPAGLGRRGVSLLKTQQSRGHLGRQPDLLPEPGREVPAAPAQLVGEHTDAILMGQLTDGAVLVLESNTTRRQVARIAKEDLEAADVRLLGAVLNKRTFTIPQFLYDRV